jgi:hypothetical protein
MQVRVNVLLRKNVISNLGWSMVDLFRGWNSGSVRESQGNYGSQSHHWVH